MRLPAGSVFAQPRQHGQSHVVYIVHCAALLDLVIYPSPVTSNSMLRIRLKMQANIDSHSDFPTLSGGPRQAPASTAAAGWNSAAIRQTSAQQQPQPQQQPQQQQQRAPSTAPSQQSLDQFDGPQRSQQPSDQTRPEDFPPLGGGPLNGEGLGSGPTTGFNSVIASAIASPDTTQRPNGPQAQLPIRDASNAAFQPPTPQAPIGSGQPAPPLQQQPVQNGQPPPGGMKKYTDMTEDEKYGLTGLAAAFEARRLYESGNGAQIDSSLPAAMRNAVFLGQDLNQLGLDLDSPDPLYPTFAPFPSTMSGVGGVGSSQFDYSERMVVPDFMLPSAYTVTNVPPLSGRMSAFSDGMPIPHKTAMRHITSANMDGRNTVLDLLHESTRYSARTR